MPQATPPAGWLKKTVLASECLARLCITVVIDHPEWFAVVLLDQILPHGTDVFAGPSVAGMDPMVRGQCQPLSLESGARCEAPHKLGRLLGSGRTVAPVHFLAVPVEDDRRGLTNETVVASKCVALFCIAVVINHRELLTVVLLD